MKSRALTIASLTLCLCTMLPVPAGAAPARADAQVMNTDPSRLLNLPAGYSYREVVDWNQWLDWGTARGIDLRKPDMNLYVPLATPLFDGTVAYLFTNHETSNNLGGVTRIALDKDHAMIGEPQIILSHMNKPCSGNLTPWGTILIGEEATDGYVWEVEPLSGSARKVEGLGRFAHETGVVDPKTGEVWSTDDGNDPAKGRGAIYKFVPDRYGDLSSGKLYALDAANGRWLPIDDPAKAPAEAKVKGATFYMKPEDAEFGPDGQLYVSISETDQDGLHWGRVLQIHPQNLRVTDFVTGSMDGLNMPDNLAFDHKGNLYIVEDSNGSNQVWIAERNGRLRRFADVVSGAASGPWFTPDHASMFFNLLTANRTVVITGF